MKGRRYLVIPAVGVGGVRRLVPNEHVVEVQPCERGDWPSVIGQMGDEAIHGRFGDVEHQQLFGSFFVFSV